MEPTFSLPDGLSKAERYAFFINDFRPFIEGETNLIAALANTAAALREAFDFFWVGFYLVADNDTLTVGPFQGGMACSRIRRGRGVCGTAWAEGRTVIVPDVDAFPGHIACSSDSRSEIVVPLTDSNGCIHAVLDIDSNRLNDFDDADRQGLEAVCSILAETLFHY